MSSPTLQYPPLPKGQKKEILGQGHNVITSHIILAVPATPQEVSAIKVTPPSEDDCIIIVNWNPPSNENTTLVKYYMVQSPSGNVTTINTKGSVIYHCDLESNAQIRIHAIDSCHRSGTSSDNIIADLLETINNSSGNVTTEPTAGGIRELKIIINGDTLTKGACIIYVRSTHALCILFSPQCSYYNNTAISQGFVCML